MNGIEKAVMAQGYDADEATAFFNEIYDRVHSGEDPEEVLAEFGLELDFYMDLI